MKNLEIAGNPTMVIGCEKHKCPKPISGTSARESKSSVTLSCWGHQNVAMQRDERNKQTVYILNLESTENTYFTEYIFGLVCSGSGIRQSSSSTTLL